MFSRKINFTNFQMRERKSFQVKENIELNLSRIHTEFYCPVFLMCNIVGIDFFSLGMNQTLIKITKGTDTVRVEKYPNLHPANKEFYFKHRMLMSTSSNFYSKKSIQ